MSTAATKPAVDPRDAVILACRRFLRAPKGSDLQERAANELDRALDEFDRQRRQINLEEVPRQ